MEFDSSRDGGAPSEFPLNGVIAGWTEGLQLMVEGEQRRFWIPEELAYRGRRGFPSGMLVFDVELIFLARRRGYRLAIVPIRWSDRRGSRMRPRLSLALRVAWDLLRIPLIHRAVGHAAIARDGRA